MICGSPSLFLYLMSTPKRTSADFSVSQYWLQRPLFLQVNFLKLETTIFHMNLWWLFSPRPWKETLRVVAWSIPLLSPSMSSSSIAPSSSTNSIFYPSCQPFPGTVSIFVFSKNFVHSSTRNCFIIFVYVLFLLGSELFQDLPWLILHCVPKS